ncbi:MAG: hypothetical protein ACD_62C00571G0002 [uncultured bacterium]|nr:MAG: hypothetical protein ACD_62C00571G0002 [uncultured bacterium]HLD43853.1 DUF933 domain-containing protein [bacterium]
MKVALLGYEYSGRKTLFSLLTGKVVPDHLIEGQVLEGMARINDARVDSLSKMYQPKKTVYVSTHFVLCPPISSGSKHDEWLKEARNADLLCVVVRDFASDDVFHPLGRVDAQGDRQNIMSELILADLMLVETRLERIAKDKLRQAKAQNLLVEEGALHKCKVVLDQEAPVSTVTFAKEEQAILNNLNLITQKSIMWCVNVAEGHANRAPGKPDEFIVSAKIEKEIVGIENPEERQMFMQDLGLKDSGLNRLNAAAYHQLGLMSFYTVGPDEVRAWTIKQGSLAPEAGGKIHSDIERGFVRVEVMKYDDLMAEKSEQKLKSLGKVYVKGRDYVIHDGDICNFLFNV